MAVLVSPTYRNANEFATTLRHEGIRIGEIIAYRAWRVIGPHWWWQGDDRLHSVLMQDYVWHPDEPASGLILAPDPFPPECPANVFLGALQADQPNPLAPAICPEVPACVMVFPGPGGDDYAAI